MTKHRLRQPISNTSMVVGFIVSAFLSIALLVLDHYMPGVASGFATFMAIFGLMALCSRIERLEEYIGESDEHQ